MSIQIIQGFVWEDSGCSFLARITGHAGTAIVQADISTITCKVFDLTLGGTEIIAPAIVVATNVFNTLQGASATDARWTADLTGFNFLHAMPATAFPTGGDKYRIEYIFTPASGAVFPLVYETPAKALFTS